MRFEKYRNGHTTVRRLFFDSYQEIVDYLSGPAVPPAPHSRKSWAEAGNGLDFWPYSWPETWKLFTAGDPSKSALIDKITDKIKARAQDQEDWAVHYEVYPGDYLDMGRFMEGDPEAFGHIETEPLPQEMVKIRVMSGIHAGVPSQRYYNRGAAVLALVDLLRERYHVQVEICSHNIYGSDGSEDYVHFTIDTRNDFSRDLVAFILTNACYHRRINFGIRECMHGRNKVYGYGRSADWRPDDSNTIYIGPLAGNTSAWRDEETAAIYLNALIKSYEENKAAATQ